MRAARTGIALLLVAGVVGCGGSDDPSPGLTSGQAQTLVRQLDAARATAATSDVAGTKAALDKFLRSVARLRRAGALSDATARSLRIGAARLLARVESDNAAAAPPVTQTAPTPAPAAEPPGQKKKHDKEHGGKDEKKHGKKDD